MTYEGWINWATWNAALTIDNDEGLLSDAMRITDAEELEDWFFDVAGWESLNGVARAFSQLTEIDFGELAEHYATKRAENWYRIVAVPRDEAARAELDNMPRDAVYDDGIILFETLEEAEEAARYNAIKAIEQFDGAVIGYRVDQSAGKFFAAD